MLVFVGALLWVFEILYVLHWLFRLKPGQPVAVVSLLLGQALVGGIGADFARSNEAMGLLSLAGLGVGVGTALFSLGRWLKWDFRPATALFPINRPEDGVR